MIDPKACWATRGRPLASAKYELKESLTDLGERHEFQIIFYNNRTTVLNPWHPQPPRMMSGSETNKTIARGFVSGIRATGGTRHMEALRLALAMGPDVIFFLTDAAEPVLSDVDLSRLKRLNSSATSINTIEFGIGPFFRARQLPGTLGKTKPRATRLCRRSSLTGGGRRRMNRTCTQRLMAGDTVAPRYAHSLQSMTRSIKSAWMIALAMMMIAATSAAAQPVRRQSTRAPSGAVWVERNGKTTVKRGAILDYRSNVIVVQNEAGRGEPISRDDVVRFEYAKSAPHREADQLLTQGAYDRAAEKYAEAMRGELSFWVQRQQQAGRIWCYRNLGKDEQAIDTYLILARNDRELVHLDAAPLAWNVSRVSPNLERKAAELAQRGESPVVKLVAHPGCSPHNNVGWVSTR